MKQVSALLALLVTTSLNAGCGACDPPDTLIDWTFTDASGRTITNDCSVAGVSFFRISLNGHAQFDASGRQDFPCSVYSGGAFVPPETNHDQVEVAAYDVNGNLLYFASDTVSSKGCGVTPYHANLSAQFGDLNLVYTLQGGQCATPSAQSVAQNTFIWFELLDQNGQVYSVVDRTHDSTAIPCDAATRTIVIPAAFGTYRVGRIQEVEIQANNQTIIVYQYNCVPSNSFSHTQPNDVITLPAMVSQAPGGTTSCFP